MVEEVVVHIVVVGGLEVLITEGAVMVMDMFLGAVVEVCPIVLSKLHVHSELR